MRRRSSLLGNSHLTYTAWIKSGEPAARFDRDQNPINPSNPRYNPATGSAPPLAPASRQWVSTVSLFEQV
jgi:hypothetical protein